MCYNVLLCVEITKSTQFLEITQTMQYTFETEKGQMVFNNHNRLLTETDYCISGKTGFTTKAGYCYVAAVEKDGRRMCLSLLGCGWPNNKTISGLMQRVWWSMRFQMLPKILTVMLLV